MKFTTTLGLLATIAMAARAHAGDCPKAVTSSVERAHAKSRIVSCGSEREDGTLVYEVKVRTAEGKPLEMEISSDGAILVTEEPIAVGDLPAAVMTGWRTAHAEVKVTGAERLISSDGSVSYEVRYTSGGRDHEIALSEAGAVLERDGHDSNGHDSSGHDSNGHDSNGHDSDGAATTHEDDD